ncbi:MAG: glucose 1-dehydrogenase [Rubrivivax sp.]|jgi:7-alpha-hydroxysteroid dehydrogenase|nr:glucose 1-dehydrogenase [Rubrivivax sp.]
MLAGVFRDQMLSGRVALVTGAGKGIGRACALALADAGADVALAARTAADVEAVAAEIRHRGRRALAIPTDVGDNAALDQLVLRTQTELGTVTVLVNNAGGSGPNDPQKMGSAEFAQVLSWNVVPAYSLIQKVAAGMATAGGGAVVNISSVAARYVQRRFSAYGAAKAALNQMTRNLAQDYAPLIRINAVEPGTVMTDALARFLTPERQERMLRSTPMGRMGQPEDIAAAVTFLCSPAASWITGQVLGVDGGVSSPNF